MMEKSQKARARSIIHQIHMLFSSKMVARERECPLRQKIQEINEEFMQDYLHNLYVASCLWRQRRYPVQNFDDLSYTLSSVLRLPDKVCQPILNHLYPFLKLEMKKALDASEILHFILFVLCSP
jgi:hypothetical protein